MNICIKTTLTGADADHYADVVSVARNEFPENEQTTTQDILGAAMEVLAGQFEHRPALRLLLQRAVNRRVNQRLALDQIAACPANLQSERGTWRAS